MKITASYTRKINHTHYGGKDYEMSDHFCSMELDTEDNPEDVYDELHGACMDNVNKSIAKEVAEFTEGMNTSKFLDIIRKYRLDNIQITDSLTEEMDMVQKNILEEFKKLKRKNNA